AATFDGVTTFGACVRTIAWNATATARQPEQSVEVALAMFALFASEPPNGAHCVALRITVGLPAVAEDWTIWFAPPATAVAGVTTIAASSSRAGSFQPRIVFHLLVARSDVRPERRLPARSGDGLPGYLRSET